MPPEIVKEFLTYIHDYQPKTPPTHGDTTLQFEVLVGQKDIAKEEIMEMFGAVQSMRIKSPEFEN